MPLFWVEQKFVMDAETSSQIRLALNIPLYGRIIGVLLSIVGLLLMSTKHLKRLFCATKPISKAHATKDAVINDEMKTLV